MKKLFIPTTLLLTPFIVFAETTSKPFQQVVSELIITGSNYILRLLVALTLFVFLWGLVKYLYKGQESDAARSEGRKLMLWGIIGLFVMTSIWGLVSLLTSIIGQEGTAVPQFRTSTTEQEVAPFGRFADGTPISAEEHAAGEELRTAIPGIVDDVTDTAGGILDSVQEVGSGVIDSVIGGVRSIGDYLNIDSQNSQ